MADKAFYFKQDGLTVSAILDGAASDPDSDVQLVAVAMGGKGGPMLMLTPEQACLLAALLVTASGEQPDG